MGIAAVVLSLAVQAPPPPAPNPALDLLKVQAWHGRVLVRIRGEGRRGDAKGCESYTIEDAAEVRFRLESGPEGAAFDAMLKNMEKMPNLPPEARKAFMRRVWGRNPMSPKKEQTVRASVFRRHHGCGEDACALDGNPFQTWTLTTTGAVDKEDVATAIVEVDAEARTFGLRVPWSERVPTTIARTGSGKNSPSLKGEVRFPGVPLDLRNQPLPKPGTPLEGTIDLTQEVKSIPPDWVKVEATLEWTLTPVPPEPLELVLKIPDYKGWLPEGAPDGKAGPKPLAVEAELRLKDGGAPKDEIERAILRLENVSDEPGVANNFPPGPLNVPFRDLALAGPGLQLDGPANLSGTARRPGRTVKFQVDAHDFGGFGLLVVEAYTRDGQYLRGFLEGDRSVVRVPIPRRTLPSRIGDAHKEALAGYAASDEAEEEAQPVGNGFAGDGLTFYEEYRGFFVDGAHVRTSPLKKDMFVVNFNPDPRVEAGIKLFESLSDLKVHRKTRKDEVLDRQINFNSRECRVVQQHGILVSDTESGLGDILAADGVDLDRKTRLTPKDFRRIRISDTTFKKPPTQAVRGGATVTGADRVEVGVAHELFHTVNVVHHGEGDHGVRWKITGAPNGPWTHLESGKPIVFKDYAGAPYAYKADLDAVILVGRKGGLRSGDADCVMRYTDGQALVDP
ncbi:MAG TPA: hypothetical protein VEJ18_17590, partial [Planctomycetota bacterium]|nr:hypothetical protein [Planctomycetota bacterium]